MIRLQEKYNYNMPSSHLINILDSLGAYVYCKDIDYKFTYANKMVGDLFGVDHHKIIGHYDSDYFAVDSAKKVREDVDRLVITGQRSIEKEETVRFNNEDQDRTFLSVKKPIITKDNKVVGLFGISTDITHYKAIENKIRLNEQKLNTILDNVAAYIYIKDTELNFTYVNKMTIDLFQLKEEEIIGHSVNDLLGAEAGKEFLLLDNQLLNSKHVVKGIERLLTPEGELFYWTVKAPLYDENNQVIGLIGMSTDISEQKKLEQQLEKTNNELKFKIDEITQLQATLWEQATQDPLTQLFNRRYFNEVAQKEISKVKRSDKSMAMLLLDADYFKKINDQFGHDVGDKVLTKLAEIMLDQCRRSDIVCRFGGEEFVILIPSISLESALARANNIRLTYEKEITSLLNGHPATISIGIAMWDENLKTDLRSLEGLTKAADQAMYQAKHNGRNQVCIYQA
jgi:diguanylate cyclase (GGDEF)-like protein/PAS domain S-box-containing protein